MIVLHKLLPMLVAPLFVLVLLALIGLALKRRWLGIFALGLLWTVSLPIVAEPLWRHLERQLRGHWSIPRRRLPPLWS